MRSKIKANMVMHIIAAVFLAACGGAQVARTAEAPISEPSTDRQSSTPMPATETLAPVASTPAISTAAPSPPPGSVVYQNPQKYRVTYIVTVYNDGFDLTELLVYQPRPREWDAQIDVQVETVSPPPKVEGVDPDYGNRMFYWQRDAEPLAGEASSFEIRFIFTAFETITDIDPADVQLYREDNPQFTLFTRSERFLEALDPEIVGIAERVAGDETNPYLLARRFYEYVVDTSSYELLDEGLRGARTLAKTGVGECGDYASLFIALCRAAGIPARPVVGYWAVSGIDQTHVWAEFYVEPFGWIPVDPTVGQSAPEWREYYFGAMDNERVILNKGFNIQLDPPGPDNYSAPFLQVPLWWFWGSGGDADRMWIERTSWTVEKLP